MGGASNTEVVDELLDRHGRTFASEAGIRIDRATPSPLFELLCLSLVSSARISADLAMAAARALLDAGLTTPEKMRDAGWDRRTEILNGAGYARYDESTSKYLGETAEAVLDRYAGDLRKLRDEADRDPDREHALLQDFTGIGAVGASMFLREVQAIWDEVDPYVDDRAKAAADDLRLPTTPGKLRALVDDASEFTRLVASLVRVEISDDADDVLEAARR